MTGLRTIYNGPAYQPVGERRADLLRLGDLVFANTGHHVAHGVVTRLAFEYGAFDLVRIRLADEVDGAFAGEATYPAGQIFRVRRLPITERTS